MLTCFPFCMEYIGILDDFQYLYPCDVITENFKVPQHCEKLIFFDAFFLFVQKCAPLRNCQQKIGGKISVTVPL